MATLASRYYFDYCYHCDYFATIVLIPIIIVLIAIILLIDIIAIFVLIEFCSQIRADFGIGDSILGRACMSASALGDACRHARVPRMAAEPPRVQDTPVWVPRDGSGPALHHHPHQ